MKEVIPNSKPDKAPPTKSGEVSGAEICSDNLPPRVHDYIEDFPHENGRYSHQCVECNTMFEGHKRRRTCKVCGDKNQQAWNALSEDEKQKRYAEIKDWMGNQNDPAES